MNEEIANLLIEAAEVLTEAKSSDNDLVKDIKDAVEEQNTNKLKKAADNFKKWYFSAKSSDDVKHGKLRDILQVMDLFISSIVLGVSMGALSFNLISLPEEIGKSIETIKYAKKLTKSTGQKTYAKIDKKFYVMILILFVSFFISLKHYMNFINNSDKIQSEEDLNKFIKNANKKAEYLKKQLDTIEDKKSKEYKEAFNAYTKITNYAEWLKSRKDYLLKKKDFDEAKALLKEAKSNKDDDAITEAKLKLKNAKNKLRQYN